MQDRDTNHGVQKGELTTGVQEGELTRSAEVRINHGVHERHLPRGA